MKKTIHTAMKKITTLLLALLLLAAPVLTTAQPAPPPPPCPSGENNKVGGGAMLEDGLQVFLGLVFLYGAYALHKTLKKTRKPEHE